MLYSNTNSVRRLKTLLMITGMSCLVAMTVLILIEQFIPVAIMAGLFLFGLLIIAILNFQYIRIFEDKNKLIFRYFSVFSLSRSYQSIEIPIEHLRKVEVFKFLFGLKWDLRLTVKIRQGLADYPLVSLSAVPFRERVKIFEQLRNLLPKQNNL